MKVFEFMHAKEATKAVLGNVSLRRLFDQAQDAAKPKEVQVTKVINREIVGERCSSRDVHASNDVYEASRHSECEVVDMQSVRKPMP